MYQPGVTLACGPVVSAYTIDSLRSTTIHDDWINQSPFVAHGDSYTVRPEGMARASDPGWSKDTRMAVRVRDSKPGLGCASVLDLVGVP